MYSLARPRLALAERVVCVCPTYFCEQNFGGDRAPGLHLLATIVTQVTLQKIV
jgi:hypothetical protein